MEDKKITMQPLSGRRKAYDRVLRFLLYFCAALTCALLIFIIGYIFVRGLPHVTWEFLSTEPSYINDTIGILPLPHARCTATPHGSWGLCMSRQTKYPELCAEFLKYVFNFQNQLKISRYTGMPVIKDIYDAMESFHAVSNQSNILFSQLRTCSFTRPQTPAYPFFSKQFSYAYYNIAQGADPKKELDLLARLTDDHLYRHNYYNL